MRGSGVTGEGFRGRHKKSVVDRQVTYVWWAVPSLSKGTAVLSARWTTAVHMLLIMAPVVAPTAAIHWGTTTTPAVHVPTPGRIPIHSAAPWPTARHHTTSTVHAIVVGAVTKNSYKTSTSKLTSYCDRNHDRVLEERNHVDFFAAVSICTVLPVHFVSHSQEP